MKILIIDDQPEKATLLSGIVSAKCAARGKELPDYAYETTPQGGLEQAEKEHFDLIFCDVNFEGCEVTGIEGVIKPHCKKQGHAPIICMSGEQQYKTEALNAGAAAFFHKPDRFTMDAVIEQYVLNVK